MSVRSTLPRSSVGAQSPLANPPAQAAEGTPIDAQLAGRRSRAARRRRLVVYGLRLLFAVVWIGSWEVSTRLNWVDPFFVGQPSGVVTRLWTWITEGTALGPLWLQAAVTMEEAVVGFIIGSVTGDPTAWHRDREVVCLISSDLAVRGTSGQEVRNAELLERYFEGADNGEFTEEQLEQIPLFLLFYAGAGNTTALFRGIEATKAKAKSHQV